MQKKLQKKVKLSVFQRRIKWAPFWTVVKKFGVGKRKHPSELTPQRRHWRRVKLKVKPRITRNKHLG